MTGVLLALRGWGQRQPHKDGGSYILHDRSGNVFTMTRAKKPTAFYT